MAQISIRRLIMIIDKSYENVSVVQMNPKIIKFPAGEIGVRLEEQDFLMHHQIVARIQNSDDIMKVLLLNDALRRDGALSVSLYMPYIPYARQDRVCVEGEALSIKVFADLINSCGFSQVISYDPHSDVAPALFNNMSVYSQFDTFGRIKKDWSDTIIVSPDGGALKKCEIFAKQVGAKDVVAAMKKRDVLTGNLEYVKMTGSVAGENVFVLDDILEGGGTFYLLAEELKEAKSKDLAITHGIFSKGYNILKWYDNVYTTNSYHGYLKSFDNLTVIKI